MTVTLARRISSSGDGSRSIRFLGQIDLDESQRGLVEFGRLLLMALTEHEGPHTTEYLLYCEGEEDV